MSTPEGFTKIPAEVWTDGTEIVVLGDPRDIPADPDEHNCDEMGCGSCCSHVIARYKVKRFDRNRARA